ncbi:hypothetical protein BC833DRAFT_515115, partial [Globomyces pollinis-pini]
EAKKKYEQDLEDRKRELEEIERIKSERIRQQKLKEIREQIDLENRCREAVQEKLRQISPCPAGFTWIQVSGGWRCGGGSHYVSDAQL